MKRRQGRRGGEEGGSVLACLSLARSSYSSFSSPHLTSFSQLFTSPSFPPFFKKFLFFPHLSCSSSREIFLFFFFSPKKVFFSCLPSFFLPQSLRTQSEAELNLHGSSSTFVTRTLITYASRKNVFFGNTNNKKDELETVFFVYLEMCVCVCVCDEGPSECVTCQIFSPPSLSFFTRIWNEREVSLLLSPSLFGR